MSNTSISPQEVSQGMRLSIIASAFTSIFLMSESMPFLTTFFAKLHATNIEVGLLTSFPLLALFFQFVAIPLTQHLPERKPTWFWLATANRMLWLVIAVVPFIVFQVGAHHAIIIFLAIYFLSNLFGQVFSPLWFSWMGDLIPANQSGRFWARKVGMISIFNILAIPLGWCVDYFPPNDITPYAFLFALAGCAGQMDIMIHNRIIEPPPIILKTRQTFFQRIAIPFKDVDFRKFLAFMCCYNFAICISEGFVILFLLTTIGSKIALTQLYVAFCAAVMWFIRWVTARYWGYLSDRFGPSAVLKLCAAAVTICPLIMVVFGTSHPKTAYLAINICWGLFNVGFESGYLTLLLGLSPANNRPVYISMLNASVGIIAAMAPILGGYFLDITSVTHTALLGDFSKYQLLFLIGWILRIIVIFSFSLKFKEMKQTSSLVLVKRFLNTSLLEFPRFHLKTKEFSGSSL